jgi:hypothetical protein
MANQGTANRVSGHMGQDWAARLFLWARCKLICPHLDIPLLPSSPLTQSIDPPQDFPEQIAARGDFCHLVRDTPTLL